MAHKSGLYVQINVQLKVRYEIRVVFGCVFFAYTINAMIELCVFVDVSV